MAVTLDCCRRLSVSKSVTRDGGRKDCLVTRRRMVSLPNRKKNDMPKKAARWVAEVKTDSTHPPPGLFSKDAATIAKTLASKKVSPKGPASGMRMLTYFLNRGGNSLDDRRRKELEKAKRLLSKRIDPKRNSARTA